MIALPVLGDQRISPGIQWSPSSWSSSTAPFSMRWPPRVYPVVSENRNESLRGLSIIVAEHSAEPLLRADCTGRATELRPGVDNLPIQTRMIPLPMVMLKVLSRRSFQRGGRAH
jgi:hypothetical protein